jgi:hypothetical protein
MIDAILARLKEKSTWAGLATLVALTGLKVSPDQLGAVATAAIALIGLFEVFRPEKK